MDTSLSNDQKQALEVLKSGANVFLDGLAGTGKTFLIDYYTRNYCSNKKVLKCCLTANALNNMTKDKKDDIFGTIHTCFNLSQLTSVIAKNKRPSWWLAKTYYSKIDVIVIDEISMCRIDYFFYIAKTIAKANKYRSKPIQIIVSGDFCQLPPIISDKEKPILFKHYQTTTGYAFEHDCWKAINFKVISLDDSLRIKNNSLYLKALNDLRLGLNLNKVLAYFNQRVIKCNKVNNTIRLFATNRLVNKVNNLCLNKLKSKAIDIPAYYDFEIRKEIKNHKLLTSNLPGVLNLKLKPKALVMFIKNDKLVKNKDRRFVNGDLGTVVKCDSVDEVVVKVKRTSKLVHLHKYNLGSSIYKQAKMLGSYIYQDEYIGIFKQYPIKLAYALTIHKAQGKTFDNVIFDPTIDKAKLTPGLVYVALSRVRDINNLYLTKPLTLDQLTTDPKVIEFYKSLKASS